jgi:hypothetical protein
MMWAALRRGEKKYPLFGNIFAFTSGLKPPGFRTRSAVGPPAEAAAAFAPYFSLFPARGVPYNSIIRFYFIERCTLYGEGTEIKTREVYSYSVCMTVSG